MTDKPYEVLSDLYADRDRDTKWECWTRSCNTETGKREEGPTNAAGTPCAKSSVGVDCYAFRRLRASGASVMDNGGTLSRWRGQSGRAAGGFAYAWSSSRPGQGTPWAM